MDRVILPPARKRSEFFEKYWRLPAVDMLIDYGFMIHETPIDDEDIVHFEDHKKMIMENIGLSGIDFNVKQEFIAEYQLTPITSFFVEGRYLRKPTGEKIYTSYYYYFYKKGYLPNGGSINSRVYAERVSKLVLLKTFEKQSLIFKKERKVVKK